MGQGFKSSEFVVMIAGLLSCVIPVVMDKVPQDSVWYVICGALLASCAYIAGRSLVKASEAKSEAVKAAADAVVSQNPPKA